MQAQTTPIRNNRLANLLIEASPVAIVLTNSNGNIEVINQVTEAWFGYRESELFGESISRLFRAESTSDHLSQSARFWPQNGTPFLDQVWELLGRRKNGAMFPVRVTLHPLVTGAGNKLLANVMDLSLDDSLKEERIQGERLAAVLEMASGLAHESRNALQRALSCLDLLELDLSEQSELLHLTNRIRCALRDLHNNYEEVKSYAAPITLRRSLVNLPELCQTAYEEIIEGNAESVPSLVIQCSDECDHVSLDPIQMTRVLRNLLQNSVHASPARSVIHCVCQFLHSDAAQSLEISVCDEGKGLSPEVETRMFEPFFTTKQQGTGLGLAVCQRIVHAHNGTIEAENQAKGGMICRIALPLSAK